MSGAAVVDPLAIFLAVLAFVLAERAAELAYARRNAARLFARGGVEHGRGHYPWMVAAHAAFYLAWTVEVVTRHPPLGVRTALALAVLVVAQAGRAWVLATLGDRWTTRVIVLPGEPLVRRGPYRWLRHPNYVVVVVELAALAIAFDAWWTLAFALVSQAAVLGVRIPVEERALAGRSRIRVDG